MSEEDDQTTKLNSLPDTIIYGDHPLLMKCPHCLAQIETQIVTKPSSVSILLALMVFILLRNLVSLLAMSVFIHLTASKKHRCNQCDTELGGDGKFLVFFQDEVYSISVGSSGLIITKKILISALLLFLGVAMLVVQRKYYLAQMESEASWQQFRTDCQDEGVCQKKYEGRHFGNWSGFVMKVAQGGPIGRYQIHNVQVLVKMQGDTLDPDLILNISPIFNTKGVFELEGILHGDEIRFTSYYRKYRHSKHPNKIMVLEGDKIEKTGRHNESIPMYLSVDEEKWIYENVEHHELTRQEITEAEKVGVDKN